MTTIRNRAKDQLPAVLLTLLSIVQALALELLWGYLTEEPALYQPTWDAVVGWTQIVATFIGLVLIWLIYATNVMRLRWVPTTRDTMFPFLVGVLEFVLVALLGTGNAGPWFLIMGFIYLTMTWVSHLSFVSARLDGENAEFFSAMRRAVWRDFLPSGVVIGFNALCGGAFLLFAPSQGPVLAALLVLIASMLYQIYEVDYYWKLTTAAAPGNARP